MTKYLSFAIIKKLNQNKNMSNFDPTEMNPNDVPLSQVEGAYLELKEHNSRHTGLGVGMANLLAAFILEHDEDSPDTANEINDDYGVIDARSPNLQDSIGVRIGEGNISQSLLAMTTDPVFDAVGLKRIDSENWMYGGGSFSNAEQRLLVVNPNKLADLLGRIKGNVAEHPGLKGMVEEIYKGLLNDIYRLATADLDKIKMGAEEIEYLLKERVHALGILQKEYLPMSVDGEVNIPLDMGVAFINWGNRPEFADFLKSRDFGLREKGTFSASEWHLDASGEYYTTEWGKLLNHYQNVCKKYGADNNLAVLMRVELEDTLGSELVFPDGYSDSYKSSILSARAEVVEQAKGLGLLH